MRTEREKMQGIKQRRKKEGRKIMLLFSEGKSQLAPENVCEFSLIYFFGKKKRSIFFGCLRMYVTLAEMVITWREGTLTLQKINKKIIT